MTRRTVRALTLASSIAVVAALTGTIGGLLAGPVGTAVGIVAPGLTIYLVLRCRPVREWVLTGEDPQPPGVKRLQ